MTDRDSVQGNELYMCVCNMGGEMGTYIPETMIHSNYLETKIDPLSSSFVELYPSLIQRFWSVKGVYLFPQSFIFNLTLFLIFQY